MAEHAFDGGKCGALVSLSEAFYLRLGLPFPPLTDRDPAEALSREHTSDVAYLSVSIGEPSRPLLPSDVGRPLSFAELGASVRGPTRVREGCC